MVSHRHNHHIVGETEKFGRFESNPREAFFERNEVMPLLMPSFGKQSHGKAHADKLGRFLENGLIAAQGIASVALSEDRHHLAEIEDFGNERLFEGVRTRQKNHTATGRQGKVDGQSVHHGVLVVGYNQDRRAFFRKIFLAPYMKSPIIGITHYPRKPFLDENIQECFALNNLEVNHNATNIAQARTRLFLNNSPMRNPSSLS